MSSSLNKIKDTFFEKLSRRNKPLMVLQLILGAILIFVWFQARSTVETPAFWTYSAILKVAVGFVMLLVGIENCLVYKRGKKDYIFWFVLALIFFRMAIDEFFFSR